MKQFWSDKQYKNDKSKSKMATIAVFIEAVGTVKNKKRIEHIYILASNRIISLYTLHSNTNYKTQFSLEKKSVIQANLNRETSGAYVMYTYTGNIF